MYMRSTDLLHGILLFGGYANIYSESEAGNLSLMEIRRGSGLTIFALQF